MKSNEIYLKKEKCTGCSACMNTCPVNAITMVYDHEGFQYPVVDEQICTNCKHCITHCQIHYQTKKKEGISPVLFAAKNCNIEIRKISSSGGLFSVFADEILNKKGVIYGVILDSKKRIVHSRAQTSEDCSKMIGSKYVQSEIGTVYKQCKQDLENGYQVLFTGTPCQIQGLKSFLIKEYDNLYTIDLLCHGGNSSLVYSDWLEFCGKSFESINFRDKQKGWHNSSISITSTNKKYINKNTELFSSLFWSHLILRPVCYSCGFATEQRTGDITLGDFWGIEKFFPDFDDNLGVSCVICNTKKGFNFFDDIKSKILFIKTNFNDYITVQPALSHPAQKPINREQFWSDYSAVGFSKVAQKYVGKGFWHRGKRLFIRLINK